MQLERITIRFMNLISFVLGHGTWLEGWQIYQTNDLLKVRDAGVVGISQVPDTSAGNNMRIRVPLSKKLNPGDAIYMIYYVVHTLIWLMLVSLAVQVLLSMLVRLINKCLF